jgi:hypothetical protein
MQRAMKLVGFATAACALIGGTLVRGNLLHEKEKPQVVDLMFSSDCGSWLASKGPTDEQKECFKSCCRSSEDYDREYGPAPTWKQYYDDVQELESRRLLESSVYRPSPAVH